jgi:hypothetical protein
MALTHSPNSIATFSGKFIEPLKPQWEDIEIEDIAHGLSNICRYGGQCAEFYSVSQHSVYVSYNCKPEMALNGLLHDGSEAYLGDVPRPIKHQPEYKFYREVEDTLQTMIYQKFGIANLAGLYDGYVYETPDIKNADSHLLLIEQKFLFAKPWISTQWSDYKYKGELLMDCFKPWTPRIAEQRFMERFRELTKDGQDDRMG